MKYIYASLVYYYSAVLKLDEKSRDKDLDMILHFLASDSGLDAGTTEACVKGKFTTNAGTFKFFGCDSINLVPDL